MRHQLTLTFSIVLVSFLSPNAQAKNREYAPLPDSLMKAKTVCIVNKSSRAREGDEAYSELRKWGRFNVVQSPADADLLFVFSSETHVAGYSTTSTSDTTGTVDIQQTGDGTATGTIKATTTGTADSTPNYRTNVFLLVVDPRTGKEIWSNVEYVGIHGAGHKAAAIGTMGYGALFMHRSGAREIIKDLRKRIENQLR